MTRRTQLFRPDRRHSVPLLASLALLSTTAAPGAVSTIAAQAAPPGRAAWEAPRTSDGHPDLQGNWSNGTLTPFEREAGRGPTFTWEEVREIERGAIEGCPANPGTVACGRAQSSGSSDAARLSGNEYNEVYWDRGSHVAIIDGEPRTSLLTRPSTGRRPPLTPEGERLAAAAGDFRSRFGESDHPELRTLQDRCMHTRAAGPPMISGGYNNNYTVVQNADYVMIVTEMVHDVRIIRLGEPEPLPKTIRPWHGVSWGRWEGSTLVVETTNVHPDQAFQGVRPSERMKMTERFTRVDEETIVYEFTIDDPTTYTEAWGGEIPFKRFDDLLYEYACHEGNYSLSGILSGARDEERRAAEKAGR